MVKQKNHSSESAEQITDFSVSSAGDNIVVVPARSSVFIDKNRKLTLVREPISEDAVAFYVCDFERP